MQCISITVDLGADLHVIDVAISSEFNSYMSSSFTACMVISNGDVRVCVPSIASKL
jgi:hypothetical protein